MTANRAAIVVLVFTLLGAVASAGAAEDAAAHYKKGRNLYNVSEYRAALEEFKQAFLLHEDPAFLYNIAQCHRQLGNHREAITFYKRFLNESPRAANRKEIERLIADLEQKAADAPRPPPAAPAPDHAARAEGQRDDAQPPSGSGAQPPPEGAPASASPPPGAPPGPAATAAEAPPSPAPAAHAGLHLEVGLGGGGLHDDFTSPGLTEGTATGGSGAFQLAATYGVLPRLALGLLLAAESVQSPRVETAGVRNDNVAVGALAFLGLSGDWRLRPGPTGWHFEAALGGARMTIKDKIGVVPDRTPAGVGGVLAAGYDWAIGQNWQWGLLARLLGCKLSDQGAHHDVVALSALIFIAYH